MEELKKIGIDFPYLKIEDDSKKNEQLAIEQDPSSVSNGVNNNHVNGVAYPSMMDGTWQKIGIEF